MKSAQKGRRRRAPFATQTSVTLINTVTCLEAGTTSYFGVVEWNSSHGCAEFLKKLCDSTQKALTARVPILFEKREVCEMFRKDPQEVPIVEFVISQLYWSYHFSQTKKATVVYGFHTCRSRIHLVPWRNSPKFAKASSLSRLDDRNQTHHIRQDSSGRAIGLTQRPLSDNTQHSRQTSIPPAGFELAIPTSEGPQTHALDSMAIRVGPIAHIVCLTYEPSRIITHSNVEF